jgi:hypothetical protein
MRRPACAYENEAASRFCVACGVSLAPRSLLMRANALIDETGAKAYEAMMLRVRSLIGDARD